MFKGTYRGQHIVGCDFNNYFVLQVADYYIVATPSRVSVHDLAERDVTDWEFFTTLAATLWAAKSECNLANLETGADNLWAGFGETKAVHGRTVHRLPDGVQVTLRNSAVVGISSDEIQVEECDPIYLVKPSATAQNKIYRKARTYTKLSEQEVALVSKGVDYRSFDEILRSSPHDFSWIPKSDYRLVTRDNVREVCQEIMAHQGIVAFDTETSGLRINFKSVSGAQGSDDVVGLVFSIREGQAWYIPLRHTAFDNVVAEEDINVFMDVYIKPILQTKDILCFNASFDSKVSMIYGIILKVKADLQTMYRTSEWHTQRGLPDSETNSMNLMPSLKDLSYHYLGRHSLSLELLLPDYLRNTKDPWGDYGNFADVPAETAVLYACPDTDNLLQMYNLFIRTGILEAYGAGKVNQIENAFSNVISYAEFFGTHVDIESIPALEADLDRQEKKLREDMFRIAGGEFNPNSAVQLARIMYTELKYPILGKTKKGSPATDKETLSKLADFLDGDERRYPLAGHMLDMRMISTYRANFLKAVHGEEVQDGFLYPKYQPLLETGRMSTSGPNIQGTPGFAKKYYNSRDDFYTFNFDFSSIEYRLLACLADEKPLIEFFNDPIKDYHRRQASTLFGTPYALVTPGIRKLAKPLNFAIPYGKGDPNLGASIYGTLTKWNTSRASLLRKRYYAGQKNVEMFFDTAKTEVARDEHFVETYFGRRRYLDPRRLGGGNYRRGLASAERAAGNHKIQGTAADLFKMGLARLFSNILKKGWFGQVLISAMVHDECNLEVHKSIAPWEILDLVVKSVCIDIPGWCPLYVGAGYGADWGFAKDQDLPVGVQNRIREFNATPPKDYEWNGDIQGWIEYTESIRFDYMVDYVFDYLNNPRFFGDVVDPDVSDYLHKIVSAKPMDGLYECLAKAVELFPGRLTAYDPSEFSVKVLPVEDDKTDFQALLDQEILDGLKSQVMYAANQTNTEDAHQQLLDVLNVNFDGAPETIIERVVDMVNGAYPIEVSVDRVKRDMRKYGSLPTPIDFQSPVEEESKDSSEGEVFPTKKDDEAAKAALSKHGYFLFELNGEALLAISTRLPLLGTFSKFASTDGDIPLIPMDPETLDFQESGLAITRAGYESAVSYVLTSSTSLNILQGMGSF